MDGAARHVPQHHADDTNQSGPERRAATADAGSPNSKEEYAGQCGGHGQTSNHSSYNTSCIEGKPQGYQANSNNSNTADYNSLCLGYAGVNKAFINILGEQSCSAHQNCAGSGYIRSPHCCQGHTTGQGVQAHNNLGHSESCLAHGHFREHNLGNHANNSADKANGENH